MKANIGLAALLLLAGCAPAAPGRSPDLVRTATIAVVPQFQGGAYQAQALVEAYTGADVRHLVLDLYTVSGNTEAPVTLGGVPVTQDVKEGGFDQPVVFKNLHMDTTYRLRASAYKSSGTAQLDLISVGAGSVLDVVVKNDDRPAVATMSIQLVDKTFSGQGTGSIEFTDGVLFDAGDEKAD